jgi:hypothetical protein
VDVGQVGGSGGRDPLLQAPVVARVGVSRAAKERFGPARVIGAGALDPGQRLLLAAAEAVWSGEQEPGGPAGRQVWPLTLGASLADIADQQVGACPGSRGP